MTSNAYPVPSDRRYHLLVRGLGWLGGFGLLSSGMALAQGATEDVTPAPTVSSIAVSPVAASPTTAPALRQPTVTLPEASPMLAPTLPVLAPVIVQPQRTQSQRVQPQRTQTVPTAVHLDQDGYDAPTSIVLNERSTGCRAVFAERTTVKRQSPVP